MTSKHKKKRSTLRNILIITLIAFAIGGYFAVRYYFNYFAPNVTGKQDFLYVRTGATYGDVVDSLKKNHVLENLKTFQWAAEQMNYVNKVKPGRYRLTNGTSNRRLINMLVSGSQEPLQLSFRNVRLKENFAALIGKQLETDSVDIITLLNDEKYTSKYGFTPNNVYTLFIPNTYEFFWNTSAKQFFDRMHDEYKKFWNEERLTKAQALNLTPIQVSILASIVDAEALVDREMPTIAGLYLNRLRKGMKLEADPTVIFANNDFTIRRVLNKHLAFNSPYNTYLHTGLPPGPILLPSVAAIDAVLNYKKHNYIYMCAKEDFSGYHNFAETLAEHLANARKFQKALTERKIMH